MAATTAAATPVPMPALPLSSAAGPGDSAGVSEAWVGSGGLSAAGPAAASAVDGSSAAAAASLLPEGPSAAAALLSGDAAASSDEDAEGPPDVSLSGAPPGDASDAVLSLGDDAAPDSEVGASDGAVSDLEAAGVAAACSGDAAGAFSDFSAAAGAFDGEADEPEAECFGEAAGASAAKATLVAAEATRMTTARARARAMVGGACDPARRFPSGGHGERSRR